MNMTLKQQQSIRDDVIPRCHIFIKSMTEARQPGAGTGDLERLNDEVKIVNDEWNGICEEISKRFVTKQNNILVFL